MATGSRSPTDPLFVLENEGLSLLVMRHATELYRSYDAGVRPLLELVEWFPGGLEGATVVDRAVGACAARIFDYLRVDQVIGLTGSLSAEHILHSAAITFSFRTTVVDIRNRDNTGPCPYEQLSLQHKDARVLITAIRAKLTESRPHRTG